MNTQNKTMIDQVKAMTTKVDAMTAKVDAINRKLENRQNLAGRLKEIMQSGQPVQIEKVDIVDALRMIANDINPAVLR